MLIQGDIPSKPTKHTKLKLKIFLQLQAAKETRAKYFNTLTVQLEFGL